MILRGSHRAPIVMLIGFVVIIVSLVFVGVHHKRGNQPDQSVPLHQSN
jgi:hypothetical protein